MIQKRWFAALAALVVLGGAPALQAQEKSCVSSCGINSFLGVVGQVFESCEECCEMPVLGQIPCIGQMFRIGGGVADKAEECKCCKCCAKGNKGECCCTKKPKTAATSVKQNNVMAAPCVTMKALKAAVRPAQTCEGQPTNVYPPIAFSAPAVYPHPIPMATHPVPMPYVVSERTMYVAPKAMKISVAKSEPDSEVRKVEWRTQSHFLGTAGHLEIQNGGTTVCCEKFMLKTTSCGSIKVCCDGGQVSIDGPCLKGKADHVTTDHQGCLVLKGNVQVSCEKDGQSVKVQGSQCTVHVADGKIAVQMK